MARARLARSNTPDEIPLAKRSSPVRRLGTRELRLGVFLLLLITIPSLFVFVNYSKESRFIKALRADQVVPSEDGRLLGHFPYKETFKENLQIVYYVVLKWMKIIMSMVKMKKHIFFRK